MLCKADDKELKGQKCFSDEKIWHYLETNQLDIRYMNSQDRSSHNQKTKAILKMERPDHFGMLHNITQHLNIQVAPVTISAQGLYMEQENQKTFSVDKTSLK